MPIGTEPYDGGTGGGLSGASRSSSSGTAGSGALGIIVISYVLSTASGSVTTASQIFSTPSVDRHAVQIVNTDDTDDLYVGFTSDVSATKFVALVAPGTSILIYASWGVNLYLFASASCSYCAHEVLLGSV